MDTMTEATSIDVEAFAAGYLECAAWLVWVDSDDQGGDDQGSTESRWIAFVDGSGVDYRSGEDTARFTLRLAGHDVAAALLPDVIDFARSNAADLAEAIEAGQDAGSLGHAFYLSRCGHGTGLWDRGLGELGDRLHKAAQVYGDAGIHVWPDAAAPCGWSFETY